MAKTTLRDIYWDKYSVGGMALGDLIKAMQNGLAQALLGNPKVIILDEPTVGLDPIQIMEIRDLIRELGKTHTVILSSHILSEVQAICDMILMITHGKLVAFDTPEELEKRAVSRGKILLTVDTDLDTITELLCQTDFVTEIDDISSSDYTTLEIKTEKEEIFDASRSVFELCVENGIVILEMSLKKTNLENVFLELAESGADKETEEIEADTDFEEFEKDEEGNE